MNKNSEILVIDDDRDDLFVYKSIFNDINLAANTKYFEAPSEIFKYLEQTKTDPFLIISDINMPQINGFQLRQKMLGSNLIKGRTSPFVYISNTGNELDIFKAHELFAIGLHKKRNDYNSQKALIVDIIKTCDTMHRAFDIAAEF